MIVFLEREKTIEFVSRTFLFVCKRGDCDVLALDLSLTQTELVI